MRKYEGKVVGILGTVIIHLVAAIIFMSFQISSLKIEQADMFTVEFDQVEVPKTQEKPIVLPASNIERILQGDEEMLNIARNLSNRPAEEINPSDYIDMVKNELIRDGKLGTDNYIDEQKKLNEMNGEDNLAMEDKTASAKDEKPSESEKMAANYQGPTRIYYDLKGRTHTYLPIPIYKCEGSGKIVLTIQVSQKGIVEEARIVEGESTTNDICLIEAAMNTALISRFNADINSPKIQTGTLTYHFVAQ
jgi:hypothetical protein